MFGLPSGEKTKLFGLPSGKAKLFCHSHYQILHLHSGNSRNGSQTFEDRSVHKQEITDTGAFHSSAQRRAHRTSIYFENNYLDVAGINLNTFSGVIDLWAFPLRNNTFECIIGNDNGGCDVAVRTDFSGNFGIHTGNSIVITEQPVAVSQWQRLSYIIEPDALKFFVDSKKVWSRKSGIESPNGSDFLRIGGRAGGSFYFNGYIDNIRILSGVYKLPSL
ncbi:MAG: LamG domain-containing protein [Desulfobacteraceae bacterium]|nr:LamG domain-containing protein [Desulfobacteraceae bacterium]